MPTSAVLTSPAVSTAVSEQPREVFVEFRAATIGEVRAIDVNADRVVLPAYVLLNREQWKTAVSPFPIDPRGRQGRTWRAPGSLIWGQLTSREGDRIVGGRDRFGLPSYPVPTEDGSIRFMPPSPDEARLESSRCEPALSPSGRIVCTSPECDGCLQALTRTGWNTTIACFCKG